MMLCKKDALFGNIFLFLTGAVNLEENTFEGQYGFKSIARTQAYHILRVL